MAAEPGLEDLPFDLIHDVISRGVDNSTLRACSLVSRLWNQASRPHLWRCVQITDGDKLIAFKRLLENAPDIAPLVKELIIEPYRPPDELLPLPTPWIANFSEILAPRLVRLQAVHFVQLLDYGDYLDDDFFRRLSAFSTVDSLVLRECRLKEHFIFSLIAAFPSLRHLRVSDVRPLVNILKEAPPLLHSPRLVSVTLDIGIKYSGLFESLVKWFLSSPTKTTLRSFSGVVHMLDAAKMGELLRGVGAVLEQLEIRLLKFAHARLEYENIKGDIDLTVCTALRVLILDGIEPACPAILSFLAEVSSPYLRTLVIPFVVKDVHSVPDFSPLAKPLANDSVFGLTDVCFLYNGTPDREVIMERLRKDLVDMYERGAVRIAIDPTFRQPVAVFEPLESLWA